MDFAFDTTLKSRKFLKDLLENLTLEQLNKVPEGFNNNIIWNIGHIIVTEQLLAYKLSGLETSVSESMINKYRKDAKPEGETSAEEVNEIKVLLFSTLRKTEQDYKAGVFKTYNAYTVSTTGNT